MSGFTIPNTPDASNQNQAEPDSLDFQIIGNQKNGIVSGMAVTPGTGEAVAVASGEVLINGVHYTFGGDTSVELTAYASTNFFDVIYARVDTGVITCYAAPGTGGLGNPRYPSSGSGSGQINFNTDVVLAVVWRTGSVAPTSGEVVDKRVFVRSNATRTNADTISSNRGSTGDIYVNSAWSSSSTLASPLSVKVGSTWYNLARYSADFTAGTITATLFSGPLSGNVTGNLTGNVTGSISGGTLNGTIGSVSGTIVGASGYLTPNVNVDPLPGPYIGWSSSNGAWGIVGSSAGGGLDFTAYRVGIVYINGYGLATASGTPIIIDGNGNLRKSSSSSRRFKENIKNYSETDSVLSLSPVTFDYKLGVLDKDLNRTGHFGLIAEDVHDAGLGHLVRYDNNGAVESVHYDLLAVELLGVIKRLSARIEALEAQ